MPRSGSSEGEEESDNDVANLKDLEYDLLKLDSTREEEEEEDYEGLKIMIWYLDYYRAKFYDRK